MKTISMKSMLALLVVMLCVACKDSSSYVNVIPKESPMVFSVNWYNLGEKASLKDYKGMVDMGLVQMQEELGDEAFQQLKQLIDDPASSGLALNEPMYIFAVPSAKGGAFVMKVTDGDALKDLLRIMSQQESGLKMEEEGERLWISAEEFMLVANDDLLLLATQVEKPTIVSLLEQKADQSIQAAEIWKAMSDVEGDLRLGIAQGELMKLMDSAEVTQLYDQMGIDMEGMCSAIGFDFLPGKLVAAFKSIVPDTMKELQEKMCSEVKGEFLKKMPENPMLWMTLGLKGEEMYKWVEKVAGQMGQADELALIKPYMESIDGEVALSVKMEGGMSMMPDFTLYAEVKNADWVAEAQQLSGLGMSVGLIDDNVFYASSNKQVMANPGENITPSVADASWADKVPGTYSFMVMESEPLKPVIDLLVTKRSERRMAHQMLDELESLEMEASSLSEGQCTLHFKDKETNALTKMIQLGMKLAM